MRHLRLVVVLLAVFALMPVIAWAADGVPASGIQGTDHDFVNGTMLQLGTDLAKGGVGVCTFCHTPHKANSTLLLWNHKLSSNKFTWDATTTTGGTPYPTIDGAAYKGTTAKCLSCHDGSVAVGQVYWYNATANTDLSKGAPVAGTNPGTTGIECSTCHDPHNKSTADVFFLRGKMTGDTAGSGYICLQCHVK